MTLDNVKPKPISLLVYVLQQLRDDRAACSVTVHLTREKAVQCAVADALSRINGLSIAEKDRRRLKILAMSPEDYNAFFVEYKRVTGTRHYIDECRLDIE